MMFAFLREPSWGQSSRDSHPLGIPGSHPRHLPDLRNPLRHEGLLTSDHNIIRDDPPKPEACSPFLVNHFCPFTISAAPCPVKRTRVEWLGKVGGEQAVKSSSVSDEPGIDSERKP
jgi:hypothetical protein